MPRRLSGTWDRRRDCYVVELGEPYVAKDGRVRRRTVALRHEDGSYVKRGDEAGRLAALARLRAHADREDLATHSPTVADLFRQFIDWHRMTGAAEATIRNYRFVLNRVVNVPLGRGVVVGDLRASAFNVEHLFAVRAWVRSVKPDNEPYVGVHERVLKNVFRWAARAIEGRDPIVILSSNPFPAGFVKGTGPGYRSDRPCPTWEELRGILDRLDELAQQASRGCKPKKATVNALAVRVIAERGCRPLEVVRLRCEDWVDAAGGFVLGRHKTSHKGVVGVIPLPAATAERVRALLAREDHRGFWAFGPYRGEHSPPNRNSLAKWWQLQRGKIGAEQYELYSFRNTISNHLRMAGIGDRELQLALRHTAPVADTVYRRDKIEEAAEVFRRAGLG